ncbi:hypothetical protein [Mycobacterium sp. 155]|uniref:hypothetical protein n=1 Tax=Mycobacterium sp. 155 TaxID=1157943 RepID=UPI000373CAD9|nr:hypothetical protein [Mycobacterium sp. 155]
MKYVLMFVETEQFTRDMAAMSDAERQRAYERVDEWFAGNAGKLRGGSKLKAAETATTVRRALKLTANPAEQAVLQQRIACVPREDLYDDRHLPTT